MEKNNGKVKLDDELLDRVSGGKYGDVGFVSVYECPHCRYPNLISDCCVSGITTWTCCNCSKQFTIDF